MQVLLMACAAYSDVWRLTPPPNLQDGDKFGSTIVVYEDTILVGTPKRNEVHVYTWSNEAADYVLKQTLVANDTQAGDSFGASVAMSSSGIAVGANAAHAGAAASGAVYMWTLDAETGQWVAGRKILSGNVQSGAQFGERVSMWEDQLLVCAAREDSDTGACYVYYRDEGGEGEWGLITRLVASDRSEGQSPGELFGHSCEIFDDIIAIGARWSSNGGGSGAVFVYRRDLGLWGQQTKLRASDLAINDVMGTELALYGDTIIASTPGKDTLGTETGAIYLFSRNVGGLNGWGQTGKWLDVDPQVDSQWANHVDLFDDELVVGIPLRNVNATNTGMVAAMDLNGHGMLGPKDILRVPGPGQYSNGYFGGTIDVYKGVIAMGEPGLDSSLFAGSVFVMTKCGDGTIDKWETCDDGGRISGDGCNGQCQLEFCGDGVVQPDLGEACDDGGLENGDACDASCLVEECGNGVVQAGELCDADEAGCSEQCSLEVPTSSSPSLSPALTFSAGFALSGLIAAGCMVLARGKGGASGQTPSAKPMV